MPRLYCVMNGVCRSKFTVEICALMAFGSKCWRREWDSNSHASNGFCNLQILKCHGCHRCRRCRGALHPIARGLHRIPTRTSDGAHPGAKFVALDLEAASSGYKMARVIFLVDSPLVYPHLQRQLIAFPTIETLSHSSMRRSISRGFSMMRRHERQPFVLECYFGGSPDRCSRIRRAVVR
jgi:hypothetical protein